MSGPQLKAPAMKRNAELMVKPQLAVNMKRARDTVEMKIPTMHPLRARPWKNLEREKQHHLKNISKQLLTSKGFKPLIITVVGLVTYCFDIELSCEYLSEAKNCYVN